MKEESLKAQLKSANEKELADLIMGVSEQVRHGRYRKVEVQRDVVTILAQKRPRVNSYTRSAYQSFVYNVGSAASKNQEVMRKLRSFAKEYNLKWN